MTGRPFEDVPLSGQQEIFWAWMRQTDPLRHPAPICAAVRVTEELDVTALEEGLTAVVRRHDALRTVFDLSGERLRPILQGDPAVHVDRRRAAGSDSAQRLTHAVELACRERERPFALGAGPLIRAVVITLDPADHVVLLSVHHLVFDAWSMGVLLRELAIAYSAVRQGRPVRFPGVVPVQPGDLVRGARARWEANRAGWNEIVTGARDGLGPFPGRKPTDRLCPRAFTFAFDDRLAERVRRTAQAHRATSFMVLLAAWGSVLASWSGRTDVLMMSPVAGRTSPGSETAMGCLFTSLLLRLDLSGQPGFADTLRRVRATTTRALELQDYPSAEFLAEFPHAPCVGYYSWTTPLHIPGLRSREFELPPQLVADLEIPGRNEGVPQLALYDTQEGPIAARLAFNSSAFDATTIEELAQDLLHFTGQVT